MDSAIGATFFGLNMLILLLVCVVPLLFMITYYIVNGVSLKRIAEQLDLEDSKYFGFIPILEYYLLTKITKKDTIIFILTIFFSPIAVIFHYEIARKLYLKDETFSILYAVMYLLFPPAFIIMLWMLSKEQISGVIE